MYRNPPVTWEETESGRTGTGQIVTPPTPPGRGTDWEGIFDRFMERLDSMLPQVVRIMELGPAAIEGSRLKMLIERGKKVINNSQATPAALSGTKEPQYTPGTAFVGLYEVAKYVATALPTMTVAQAIEALEAVGVILPTAFRESIKGYMNQQLNTLLLFGLPLKQRDIQAFLARLPELDPSFVPESGDATGIPTPPEATQEASYEGTDVLKAEKVG